MSSFHLPGVLTMIIAHPVAKLAAECFAALRGAARNKAAPAQRLIGFDIFTAENI